MAVAELERQPWMKMGSPQTAQTDEAAAQSMPSYQWSGRPQHLRVLFRAYSLVDSLSDATLETAVMIRITRPSIVYEPSTRFLPSAPLSLPPLLFFGFVHVV